MKKISLVMCVILLGTGVSFAQIKNQYVQNRIIKNNKLSNENNHSWITGSVYDSKYEIKINGNKFVVFSIVVVNT